MTLSYALREGETLNNFNFAQAIYEECKEQRVVGVDAETVAKMILVQVEADEKGSNQYANYPRLP